MPENIPAKYTETGLTLDEVKVAFLAHPPVTVEGFTGYVCEYDPIPCANGGTRWFYLCRTIADLSDPFAEEIGPFAFNRH